DFHYLSRATPLLASVYPNGKADVNQFQAAGGPGFIIRELIDDGLMDPEVVTVAAGGLREYGKVPQMEDTRLVWKELPAESGDETVVRKADNPFSATGGLRLLKGNLGRSVIKISAVPEDRHIIEAPAIVFETQEELLAAFEEGELE